MNRHYRSFDEVVFGNGTPPVRDGYKPITQEEYANMSHFERVVFGNGIPQAFGRKKHVTQDDSTTMNHFNDDLFIFTKEE